MRISLSRGSISHADSLPGGAFLMRIPFRGSISHADFPFLGEHFSCGFPFRGAFLMRIPFRGEHFSCGFPSGGSISHADSLPGEHFSCGFPSVGEHFSCGFPSRGAFCMRQVRGGEAFIVAKAIVPSSRSSPPGHAAVLRVVECVTLLTGRWILRYWTLQVVPM